MSRFLLISLLVATVLGATAGDAGPAAAPPTRVTMIGDSVASVLSSEVPARRVIERGIDLDLQLAVCRRLVGESCPYQGSRPLSLVDLLPTLRLGSTVVVAVGYNDSESTFADSVETALKALRKQGVQHILWLTLRAERQSYLRMNGVIEAAAAANPDVSIVDWNLYSRSHPEWFQDDGLHLNFDGALEMARLVHRSLDELGVVAAPTVRRLAIATKTLPTARVDRHYLARLTVSGGTRPITWTLRSGALPVGLRLLRNGRLTGTPRTVGRATANLRATDAKRQAVFRRFVITVRAR